VYRLPAIGDRELTIVDIDLTVVDINDCTNVTTFTSPIVNAQSVAANVQSPAEKALETAG
jgi:hypothetical protein